jgi:hypothetical protein
MDTWAGAENPFLSTDQDIEQYITFLHTSEGQTLIENYNKKLGGNK